MKKVFLIFSILLISLNVLAKSEVTSCDVYIDQTELHASKLDTWVIGDSNEELAQFVITANLAKRECLEQFSTAQQNNIFRLMEEFGLKPVATFLGNCPSKDLKASGFCQLTNAKFLNNLYKAKTTY